MRSVRGKRALITGGARRLGRDCALALAARGVDIILHYNHSEAEARRTEEQIRSLGAACRIYRQDLQDSEQSIAFVRSLMKQHDIQILVNSASVFPADTLPEITPDSLLYNLSVNAYAPFFLARELAENGKLTDIVNFLDTRITGPDTAHASYHISKRMLHTMTMMLAEELAPQVRVNAIAPGPVLLPEGASSQLAERLKDQVPLQAIGAPEDVTEALLYLLQSSYVTGQVLYIDGGMHIRGNRYNA